MQMEKYRFVDRTGSRIEQSMAGTQCALKTQMQLHVLDHNLSSAILQFQSKLFNVYCLVSDFSSRIPCQAPLISK